jgi:hypothetical protein
MRANHIRLARSTRFRRGDVVAHARTFSHLSTIPTVLGAKHDFDARRTRHCVCDEVPPGMRVMSSVRLDTDAGVHETPSSRSVTWAWVDDDWGHWRVSVEVDLVCGWTIYATGERNRKLVRSAACRREATYDTLGRALRAVAADVPLREARELLRTLGDIVVYGDELAVPR